MVCGLAFLGWRALKDEVSWVTDFPLCLLLAAAAMLGLAIVLVLPKVEVETVSHLCFTEESL
jgi:hypothetical protein